MARMKKIFVGMPETEAKASSGKNPLPNGTSGYI